MLLIKRFAEYVMQSRVNAALLALLFAFIPFMGWLSVVIMALVTLRNGWLDGLYIFFMTLIPAAIFTSMGNYQPLLVNVIGGSFVVWLFAILLRETRSWQTVLQVTAVFGVIFVGIAHYWYPNIDAMWSQFLDHIYLSTEKKIEVNIPPELLKKTIAMLAKIATGILFISIMFINLINLAVGRWLQSMLYYEGGFIQEILNLKLGIFANALLVITLILLKINFNFAIDLAPIVVGLFFIAGLSLLHAFVLPLRYAWAWLIAFYLLLIFKAIFVILLVSLVAVIDSWVDFRKHYLYLVAK